MKLSSTASTLNPLCWCVPTRIASEGSSSHESAGALDLCSADSARGSSTPQLSTAAGTPPLVGSRRRRLWNRLDLCRLWCMCGFLRLRLCPGGRLWRHPQRLRHRSGSASGAGKIPAADAAASATVGTSGDGRTPVLWRQTHSLRGTLEPRQRPPPPLGVACLDAGHLLHSNIHNLLPTPDSGHPLRWEWLVATPGTFFTQTSTTCFRRPTAATPIAGSGLS